MLPPMGSVAIILFFNANCDKSSYFITAIRVIQLKDSDD
jgi:hypothetical protein